MEFLSYVVYKRSYTSKYEAFATNLTISGFAAAILDSWMALNLIGLHDFVAQSYLRKVTKEFHSTPSDSETTAKNRPGVKLSPSHPTRVKRSMETN